MRRRGLIVLAAAVAALLAIGGFVAWRDSDDRVRDASDQTALATRTVAAGDVTVEIEPRRIDRAGAEFTITFDTHSVELDLDVAAHARLTVGGISWPDATWTGDGPGGHHRVGVLRFESESSATGRVDLRLDGLPAPVTATWTLPG